MSTDAEEVATAVVAALKTQRSIDDKTHEAHHDFIDTVIIETRRKQDLRESIKKQVFGWGIIALLAGAGKLVYHAFKNYL